MSGGTLTSRTHNVGAYFFYIENLPKRYTWQHLKDLIRKEASHGIWTEMTFYSNGQPGSTGWARVQRTDEARKLYSKLSDYLTAGMVEGRCLRVHLWDCSQSAPKVMQCNCDESSLHGPQGAEVSRMASETSWQTMASAMPTSTASPVSSPASPTYPSLPAPQYAPMPAAIPPPNQNQQILTAACDILRRLYVNRGDQAAIAAWQSFRTNYPQQALQAQQALSAQLAPTNTPQQNPYQSPMYMSAANGTPVNVSRGAVRTEYRGIFVSGLNYKAHRKDVEAYFGRAGRITALEVQKDPTTGKSKGNATVQYSSAEEASKAVRDFHGTSFMKMRLNVRMDTEATAVSTPSNGALRAQMQKKATAEPLIVNGSSTNQSGTGSRRKDSVVSGSVC